jgi:alkylhydroperoxidase domain protein
VSSGSRAGTNPTRPGAFTQQRLDWVPWVTPLEREDADAEQLATLDAAHGDSPYFRLLARAVGILRERSATDRGIFYTHGGLPRAERELSATAASKVNGCIFCASVHSHFASQLSKRPQDVQRVLDDGAAAELDPRWHAIVVFASALSETPSQATADSVQALRAQGLSDLEILDVIQSTAFFAWANRLMLTLGEPTASDAGWG